MELNDLGNIGKLLYNLYTRNKVDLAYVESFLNAGKVTQDEYNFIIEEKL